MYDMYKDHIIDHWRNPRNYGVLEDANIVQKEINTLCGDEIEIYMIIKKSIVENVRFSGKGCAISLAAASIMMEYIKNKHINEIKNLTKEDVLNMLGIPISPMSRSTEPYL